MLTAKGLAGKKYFLTLLKWSYLHNKTKIQIYLLNMAFISFVN